MRAALIDDFCADGYLAVRRAVAPDVVRGCVDVIDAELRARGVEPRDAATWTEPVVRLPCPEGPAPARRDTRATCSSATPSWSTARPGRIAAPARA